MKRSGSYLLAILLIALSGQPVTAQENVLHVDGYDLRYVIEGNGLDALVIGSSVYYPRVFSSELRLRLRLTFIDGRHFAPTPSKAQDVAAITLDTITDEIESARAMLSLRRFVIIGHSNHGAIAVAYALKYPQHVSHVVIIGAAPYRTAGALDPIQYWNRYASKARQAAWSISQQRWEAEVQREPLPDDLEFIRAYAFQGPARWYDYHFDQLPLWEGIRMNWRVASRYSEVIDGVIDEGVPQLGKPVLVILGRHDYPVPPPNWDGLAGLPHVAVRVFGRSGHNPMLEQARKFDRTLLKWLERNPDDGA